jgi:hypothetical protein
MKTESKFCPGCGAQVSQGSQPPGSVHAESPIWWDVQSPADKTAAIMPQYARPVKTPKSKKLPVIAAAASAVILLAGLGWLLFPTILKAVNTDAYIGYALTRTESTLSSELKSVQRGLGIPELSGGSYRLAMDLNGISGSIYDRWSGSNSFDLSRLQAGYDLIYDLDSKRASLDVSAGWGGETVLLTLFADMQRIAAGYNNDVSWVAGTSSIGRELAGLGVPVDANMTLDMGFLFPEASAGEEWENEIGEILKTYMESLRFRDNPNADMPDGFRGSAMTATIDDADLQEMLMAIIDLYLEYMREVIRTQDYILNAAGTSADAMIREMRDQARRDIRNIRLRDAELTLFINSRNIVTGVQFDMSQSGTDVSISAHLRGERNLIDNILIRISARDQYGRGTLTIESEGRHVPVNGEFSSTTTIRGSGSAAQAVPETIRIRTNINESGRLSFSVQAGPDEIISLTGRLRTASDSFSLTLNSVDVNFGYASVNLDGELTVLISSDVSGVRDITRNAHSLADFNISQLNGLIRAVERIIQQDGIPWEISRELNNLIRYW